MQTPYVAQVAVPVPSNPIPIEQLVKQMLAAKAADANADVSAWEREIDQRVYALYGLQAEKIRMIEESVLGGSA